ncbi:MAG TPA: hypothetical protein VGH51_06170 [Candidatus Angelobacter sp.]
MTPQQITFLLAGLTAGLVTVVGGRAWPTLLPMLLVCGVGPLFFVAVLTAITLTGSWSHLSHGWWRIVAGICICTGAYLLALFTFLAVAGYSGIPTSTDQIRFGADVWVGLLAAALVASACIELLVFVLTGKWSNSFLFRLAAAGVVTVLVTFVVDLAAHHYWTFYGILLPVGEGLFCWLVGAQIWRVSQRLAVPAM